MNEFLYRAVRFSSYPIADDRTLIHVVEPRQLIECPRIVAAVLSSCQGCRTLDGHWSRLTDLLRPDDPSTIRKALESLIATDLLQPCLDPARPSPVVPQAQQLDTIALLTADRPDLLRRSLRSVLKVCVNHKRAPRFIVVDGSTNDHVRDLNREVVQHLTHEIPMDVTVLGAAELTRHQPSLESICGAECRMFALSPGRNRNIALLASRGGKVLFIDDDVIVDTWCLQSAQDHVRLCGHAESRTIAFFPTHDDALRARTRVDIDFLRAHERLLGQPLTALVRCADAIPNITEACGHLLDALNGGTAVSVRATSSGVAGDSGIDSCGRLLLATGSWMTQLNSGRSTYDCAIRSREVHCIADSNLITHEPPRMAGCFAIDSQPFTPPFIPLIHNDDAVFGTTLTAIDQGALFGHIPFGVIRGSDDIAVADRWLFQSSAETRTGDLLALLLLNRASTLLATDSRRRLEQLASFLTDLSRLDLRDLITLTMDTILSARHRELMFIETALARGTDHQSYWLDDLWRYHELLLKNLCNPPFFLPLEFHGSRSLNDGFLALQDYIGRVATLFHAWPALWDSTDLSFGG